MVKWKIAYLEQISKMTNEEVLDEYSGLVGGDDYDGCFTERGNWQFDQITTEFRKRLVEIGYLKE
jgi:hypothetical protein